MPRKRIPPDVRSLARGYTSEAIRRLAAIMRDPGKDQPTSVSVSAAAILLERGWGRPAQPHTGADGESDIRITIRNIIEGKK